MGLARLAARQHGVVSLTQLQRLGWSASAVRERHAAGHLHRVHRGVYAVGHRRLTRRGRFMAAVLACGKSAALSHRSAASLLDLRPSTRLVVDVTVSGRRVRSRAGIQAHIATLINRDVGRVDRIPCTSVGRTLVDMAGVVDAQGLDRAIERAELLRVFDLAEIDDLLDRAEGHRGASKLRQALALYLPDHHLTRSELERRFLGLCESHSLPSPVTNGRITVGGDNLEVDFHWPAQRLVVETDGHRTHSTHAAFERDRRRDQMLTAAGWRVLRFTWHQLARRPGEVAETVRALLSTGAGASA
jgi:predicted transcriptional regulator of viral defense system